MNLETILGIEESIFFVGEPVFAHKDPGRLLLLRVRAAGALLRPRAQRGGDGPRYDRRYHVSLN